MVLARNTLSGQIADVSPKMLLHPKFKDVLEVVEETAKPYAPELYKPGTKQEKKAARKSTRSEAEEAEVLEEATATEESIKTEEEK